MSAIDDQKGVARAAARSARRSIPVGTRADHSVLICAHIESSELWSSARVVTAFLPIQSEVDLLPLLVGRLGGRTLGIPRTENDVMTFDSVDLHNPDGLHIGEFGITVAQRGLWREAIYRWERAAQIDPTYAAAQNNLAIAYEHEGDLDKARAAYEKAMELEPLPRNPTPEEQLYRIIREGRVSAAPSDGRSWPTLRATNSASRPDDCARRVRRGAVIAGPSRP